MIYLKKGYFKPMFILLLIAFVPSTIGCVGATIFYFSVPRLLISIFLFLAFVFLGVLTYKISKTTKFRLEIRENKAILIDYETVCGTQHLELDVHDIIQIEYYKITSFFAWMCILNASNAPQNAFVSYLREGKEFRTLIGQPNKDEIRKVCEDLGIRFVIK